MTEAKTDPVCRWCGKTYTQHVYHAPRWALCRSGGTLFFTPAESERDDAQASATKNWQLFNETRGKLATVTAERDAAIERAEKAEADAREFGGNAYRRLEARAENAENRNVNLQGKVAAVTAERDEWRQAKGEEIEYSNRLELERDKMRPVIEAARSVVGKLLAEIRREGVTAQWAYKREYVALIDAVDALDAAKPAEPKRCNENCWRVTDGTIHAGDCPVHGVERAGHRATFGEWNCGALGMQMYSMDPERVAAEIASWDAEPAPLPTKCEWWDTGDEGTDRCESGKPAAYITCEFTPPARVCEDHKCRCKQPPQPITPPPVDPRDARIAELETMLASTRKTWNEQVQELEIDRDQQRARADAAEARCEAGLPLLFTGAKEKNK